MFVKSDSLGFSFQRWFQIFCPSAFSSLIYTPVMIIVGKYDDSQTYRFFSCSCSGFSDDGLISAGSGKRVQSFIHEVSMKNISVYASDFYQTIHQANHGILLICGWRFSVFLTQGLNLFCFNVLFNTPIARRLDLQEIALFMAFP